MIQSQPMMFDIGKLDPITLRLEMWNARHGLGLIAPEFILPKFDFEPFTLDELKAIFNYKRANTSKLRSIIRDQKRKHER